MILQLAILVNGVEQMRTVMEFVKYVRTRWQKKKTIRGSVSVLVHVSFMNGSQISNETCVDEK